MSRSSRRRRTAARAGESWASAPIRVYGDSYSWTCLELDSSTRGRSSGSYLVDLTRRLLPDYDLDFLALFWPVGVSIDDTDIRATGGGRASSAPVGSLVRGSDG